MENNDPIKTIQRPIVIEWDSLTDTEKIERLRDVIKDQSRRLMDQDSAIYRLRQSLRLHEHKDGKAVEIKEIPSYDDGAVDNMRLAGSSNTKYI